MSVPPKKRKDTLGNVSCDNDDGSAGPENASPEPHPPQTLPAEQATDVTADTPVPSGAAVMQEDKECTAIVPLPTTSPNSNDVSILEENPVGLADDQPITLDTTETGEDNAVSLIQKPGSAVPSSSALVAVQKEAAVLYKPGKDPDIGRLKTENTNLRKYLKLVLDHLKIPQAETIDERMKKYSLRRKILKQEPPSDSRFRQTAILDTPTPENEHYEVGELRAWQVFQGDDGAASFRIRHQWVDGEQDLEYLDGCAEFWGDFLNWCGSFAFLMMVGRLGKEPFKQYLHIQPATYRPGERRDRHPLVPNELRYREKVYLCVPCVQTFPSRYRLNLHCKKPIHLKHVIATFPQCNCCKEDFGTLAQLDTHVETNKCLKYCEEAVQAVKPLEPTQQENAVKIEKIKTHLSSFFTNFEELLQGDDDVTGDKLIAHMKELVKKNKEEKGKPEVSSARKMHLIARNARYSKGKESNADSFEDTDDEIGQLEIAEPTPRPSSRIARTTKRVASKRKIVQGISRARPRKILRPSSKRSAAAKKTERSKKTIASGSDTNTIEFSSGADTDASENQGEKNAKSTPGPSRTNRRVTKTVVANTKANSCIGISSSPLHEAAKSSPEKRIVTSRKTIRKKTYNVSDSDSSEQSGSENEDPEKNIAEPTTAPSKPKGGRPKPKDETAKKRTFDGVVQQAKANTTNKRTRTLPERAARLVPPKRTIRHDYT